MEEIQNYDAFIGLNKFSLVTKTFVSLEFPPKFWQNKFILRQNLPQSTKDVFKFCDLQIASSNQIDFGGVVTAGAVVAVAAAVIVLLCPMFDFVPTCRELFISFVKSSMFMRHQETDLFLTIKSFQTCAGLQLRLSIRLFKHLGLEPRTTYGAFSFGLLGARILFLWASGSINRP